MSVVIDYKGEAHLFIKGASEIVLAACDKWMNAQTGEVQAIDEITKDQMEQAIVSMAEQSLRTLCFAFKNKGAEDDITTCDDKGVY